MLCSFYILLFPDPFDPRIILRVLFSKKLSLGSSLNMKQQNVWGHQKLSEYDLETHRF
jgi:hypothetical protein